MGFSESPFSVSSPLFPRLLVPEAVKSTIARGVEYGLFAYRGMLPGGGYERFGSSKNKWDKDLHR